MQSVTQIQPANWIEEAGWSASHAFGSRTAQRTLQSASARWVVAANEACLRRFALQDFPAMRLATEGPAGLGPSAKAPEGCFAPSS
jgi:hypothetical protein